MLAKNCLSYRNFYSLHYLVLMVLKSSSSFRVIFVDVLSMITHLFHSEVDETRQTEIIGPYVQMQLIGPVSDDLVLCC